jgi:hypothetical protein
MSCNDNETLFVTCIRYYWACSRAFFQRLSVEALKKTTSEGVEPETDLSPYNGPCEVGSHGGG